MHTQLEGLTCISDTCRYPCRAIYRTFGICEVAIVRRTARVLLGIIHIRLTGLSIAFQVHGYLPQLHAPFEFAAILISQSDGPRCHRGVAEMRPTATLPSGKPHCSVSMVSQPGLGSPDTSCR